MLLLPMLLACRGPEPAPTNFEELLGWVLQHTGDEDTATLDEGLVNLDTWMNAHLDETLDGYGIDILTNEQIAPLGVGDRTLSGLHGVAVGYSYASGYDAVAEARMVMPTTVNEDGETVYSEEITEGDRECWAEGSCDWLDLTYASHEDLALGVSIDLYMQAQYRRLDTSLGPVLLERSWSTKSPELNTELFSIDQLYFVWAFLPHGDEYRSMSGEWVAATANDKDLDIDLIYNLWLGGLVDREENLDARAAAY